MGGRAHVRGGSAEKWTLIPGTLDKDSRINAQTCRRCSHKGTRKAESNKIALLTSSKDHVVTAPKIAVLPIRTQKIQKVTGYAVLVSFLSL